MTSIGVDMGSTTVKIVGLSATESGWRLEAHALVPTSDHPQLRQVFQSKLIQSGKVRVNIEDPSIKIRRIEVPRVPDEELPEVIKWSMKDVVAGPVDDYVFRHQVLPAVSGKTEQPYLAFIIHREVLQKRLVLIRQLGLPAPEIVEPNVAALVLTAVKGHAIAPEEKAVVVDIGTIAATFAVVSHEGLLFSRPLGGVAGDMLTKQISRGMGLSEEEAEKLKIGAASPEDAEKLKNVLGNYLSTTVLEIQRSIDAYLAQFPSLAVSKVLLTGAGCQLAGLSAHVGSTLKVPTDVLNPWGRIDLGGLSDLPACYYGLACGLALD